MANIKAGVAYVDVALGSAKPLIDSIKAEVEKAGQQAGKAAGKSVSDSLAKTTTAKPAASKIVSDFQYAKARVLNALAPVGSAIAKPFQAAWSGVSKAWTTTAGKITSGVSSISTFVQTRFPRAFQAATVAVNKFKTSLGAVGAGAASKLAAVGSFFLALPGKISAASAAVSKFGQKLGLLGFQVKSLGALMTLAFTAPVVGVGILATAVGIKLAAQIETVTVIMTQKFGPAGKEFVKQLEAMAAASPVFDTTSILEYAQRFTSAGLNIKQTMDFLKAFSNIAQTAGVTSTDKMNLALEAFAQILSKGKVQSEELVQQLAESLPGAVQIAAEAMHTTTPKLLEDLKAGKVSAQDFVAAITKLGLTDKYAKPAEKAADTLSSRWSQLKEHFQTGLAQAVLDNMDKIKQALQNIQPYVDKFVKDFAKALPTAIDWFGKFFKAIDTLAEKYKNLSPSQKDLIKKLALIAVVAGPVIAIVGSLATALGAIIGVIGFLGSEVGLIVLAIVGLVVGIVALVKWFQNMYREGGKVKGFFDGLGELFKKLGDSLRKEAIPFVKEVKGAWDQLKKTFTDPEVIGVLKAFGVVILAVFAIIGAVVFGVVKAVFSALGPLIRAIASFVSGLFKIITGSFDFFGDLFTGKWSKLGKDIEKIWDGLWDAIVGTVVNLGRAVWGLIWGLISGIIDFFKFLYDVLVGHSIIPDMVNAIIDWFKKFVKWLVGIFVQAAQIFWNWIKGTVIPVKDAVVNAFNAVLEFFRGMPDKIKGIFSGALNFLVDVGKNIVQGLINGIKSMASLVKDTLVGLLPDPLKKFASKLGIESPSKVFKKFGVYTVLGYNEGIKAAKPKTVEAMKNWAQTITKQGVSNVGAGGAALEMGTSSNSPKAAINIENYNAGDDDPGTIAERFYFLVTARGGNV